jgi:hypothetical protein
VINVKVIAFIVEREREEEVELEERETFAEVEGTFPKAARKHINQGRYNT